MGDLPYLVHREKMERQQMCIAARKRIQDPPIIMASEDWPGKTQKYEIMYPNERRVNVAAFECNSVPTIYIRIVNDNSPNQFIVSMIQP